MPRDHAAHPSTTVERRQVLRDRRSAEIEHLLRLGAAVDADRRASYQDRAVELGVPMAHTLAARYRQRGVEREDLNQIACVGLVKAVRGYRPGPETDFRSYAVPTIRGELRKHFRDTAWMVRPPRRIQDLQTAINATEGELAIRLQRWPTYDDLATAIGVPAGEIVDAQRAQGCFHPVSLDARLRTAPDLTLEHLLSGPGNTYELVEHVETLRPVVAQLPERDRLILRRRFVDHRSQAEIGAEIGVSQMQVSRLLQRIMLLLRSALLA
ncbi:sigma-70 family RNA polymerase sigma factor [Kribbella lupini]|uniref:RNA polymerase sigma factor SigF n=1 Tax=Kribbella lupini TaxID=291602 RepID=A0ABN2AKB0_9ACTN